MTTKNKRQQNDTRHAFLLTFFSDNDTYEEIELNGFWLIKQWNDTAQKWQVAIYSQESYANKKKAQENRNRLQYLLDKEK